MTKIGTRGSKLALWQAHDLRSQVKQIGVEAELCIIKTKGDEIQNLSFDKIEGKGFFTKEIEDSLLAGEVDIAVHSLKDLPTISPEGLMIAGLSKRARPHDILIIRSQAIDKDRTLQIKKNSLIGTSSVRRKVQLKTFDPSISFVDIRGNVPTRLKKLKEGQCDAIILASAGVDRLTIELSEYKVIHFDPTEFVPAPAQGVIAYQCRTNDTATRQIVKSIHQHETAICTNVERSILKMMDGGCQLPLGAYCYTDALGYYHCYAAYSSDIDAPLKRVNLSQSTHYQLAEKIVDQLTKPGH